MCKERLIRLQKFVEREPEKTHVLVVDDDENALKIAGAMFQEHGCTVDTAETVDEAINKSDHAHVVLLDVFMPGNGKNALDTIRQKHPTLPIVMWTGMDRVDAIRELGGSTGFFNLIQKPPTVDDIKSMLFQLKLA